MHAARRVHLGGSQSRCVISTALHNQSLTDPHPTGELEWYEETLKAAIASCPPSLSLVVDAYITGPPSSLPTLDENEGTDVEKRLPRTNSTDSDMDEKKSSDASSSEVASTNEVAASGAVTPDTVVQTPGRPTRRHGVRPHVSKILEDEVTCAAGPVSVDGAYSFLPALVVVIAPAIVALTHRARYSVWPGFAGGGGPRGASRAVRGADGGAPRHAVRAAERGAV